MFGLRVAGEINLNIQPVILCGGAGTRLWPLSRELFPKQLLSLVGEHSLLQNTLGRLGNVSTEDPLIICNEQHRFLVAEQLLEAGYRHGGIMLEPVGRNTAPAIALAALHIASRDPDAILLVLPSDHVIANVAAFEQAVTTAANLADQGRLVTFGIVPTSPNTGYGYIERGEPLEGGFEVSRLVEKPDTDIANKYFQDQNFYWNGGMFAFRAGDFLDELRRFRPDIVSAVEQAVAGIQADADFLRVGKEAFEQCPAESIDYAVMENTDKAAMVPLDAGWNDVGSWPSLLEVLPRDEQGNHLHGDVVAHRVRNSYVRAEHRLVSVIGLEDVIVVETADAVLVGNKATMQHVKDVVQHLNDCERHEPVTHRKVFRPWGNYESVNDGTRHQVKHIEVKPGASLSLQLHHQRAEHWVVVSGTARVNRDEEVFDLEVNQSTYIPIGTKHRLENPGNEPLRIIEIQSGDYLGEDDIVRFEDNYGRA